MKIPSYYFSKKKRLFDIVGSLTILFFIWPIFVLIGILVFFTTGKPIIFTQRRMGKNNTIFIIYKFRTMVNDAEQKKKKLLGINEAPGPMFKIDDDPRFVGLGKFLSHSGLDEIPQLINVLKNEMSLVGPRPLPVDESTQLPSDWNFRFAVKPGIFSFWTLDKNRHESMKKWKELEVKTIKHCGTLTEIKLIASILINQLLKISR